MHEFSIALNIIDIVSEHAQKEKSGKVLEVELEIGDLSGVVIDALEFAMESAVKNSIMEGAKVNIHRINGKARCVECSHEYAVDNNYEPCPKCGHAPPDIIRGRELRVKSVLLE